MPLNGLTPISSKENKDELWKSTANLSGLRLTPQYAHRKSNATSQGLTMDPHIQEQKKQYDHRICKCQLTGTYNCNLTYKHTDQTMITG